MTAHFFKRIGFRPEQINIPDGKAIDLQRECAEYERKIAQAGGIDLLICGLGRDGHIAFNEPGSSLSSGTRVKSLTFETRLDNSRFFEDDIEKVPTHAITVGMRTIMDSSEVLMIATGRAKARAMSHTIEEGINHMWPAGMLQMHSKVTVVCDEAATWGLHVRTVEYFKQMQANRPESP